MNEGIEIRGKGKKRSAFGNLDDRKQQKTIGKEKDNRQRKSSY